MADDELKLKYDFEPKADMVRLGPDGRPDLSQGLTMAELYAQRLLQAACRGFLERKRRKHLLAAKQAATQERRAGMQATRLQLLLEQAAREIGMSEEALDAPVMAQPLQLEYRPQLQRPPPAAKRR